jgi:hypothetical protein
MPHDSHWNSHTSCVSSFLLLSAIFASTARAQESRDLSADWTLKIGQRIFVVLTVAAESTAHITGSLARLQHFSSSGDGSFSNIKGPVVRYPIVRGTVKGNCLFFTTQNPGDKTDEDDFQLCITGQGHGTLKPDEPGVEPWPVTKEKGALIVDTGWDSARIYYLDDTDVSDSEMQRISEEDQKDRQPGIGKIDWTVVSNQTRPAVKPRPNFFPMGNSTPEKTSKELPSYFSMGMRQTTTYWPIRWQ